MRFIGFDTETTGMNFSRGGPIYADPKGSKNHRIIEIACLEYSDEQTPRTLHHYCNPGRPVEPGAFKVHGISDKFLKEHPPFSAMVEEFIAFVEGATLIAHNAPFDVAFVNHELSLAGYKELTHYCADIIDTLAIARKKYPGRKNSLDALCQRLSVDLSGRELHGALKDTQLLLQVYRKLMGGQSELILKNKQEAFTHIAPAALDLKKITLTPQEEQAHEQFMQAYLNKEV